MFKVIFVSQIVHLVRNLYNDINLHAFGLKGDLNFTNWDTKVQFKYINYFQVYFKKNPIIYYNSIIHVLFLSLGNTILRLQRI